MQLEFMLCRPNITVQNVKINNKLEKKRVRSELSVHSDSISGLALPSCAFAHTKLIEVGSKFIG